jgi:hypothetical protein
MLRKLQVNTLEEDEEADIDAEEEVDKVDEYHPNDMGFFVDDEDSVQVLSHDLSGT